MHPALFVLAASVPLLVWLSLLGAFIAWSRRGGFAVRVNVPAILGAFLCFLSLSTRWSVYEVGYDWVAATGFSIFLLFILPFAVVTPLAGLPQAAVLLWVFGFMLEQDASMNPLSTVGYTIAWVSTGLMCAGIVHPVGIPSIREGSDIWDRTLTMTFRSSSGVWMPTKQTLKLLFAVILLAFGIFGLIVDAPITAYAMLAIGFGFIWFLLDKEPRAEVADAVNEQSSVPKSQTAWVVFVALVYSLAVIGILTFVYAFGEGFHGEEKTAALIRGLILLAVVFPLTVWIHRRAVAPVLPTRLVNASLAAFCTFIILASLTLSTSFRIGLSTVECSFFAGAALILPMYFYVSSKGDKKSRQ